MRRLDQLSSTSACSSLQRRTRLVPDARAQKLRIENALARKIEHANRKDFALVRRRFRQVQVLADFIERGRDGVRCVRLENRIPDARVKSACHWVLLTVCSTLPSLLEGFSSPGWQNSVCSLPDRWRNFLQAARTFMTKRVFAGSRPRENAAAVSKLAC